MRKKYMRRRQRQLKPEMLGEILHKILKKRNIPHTSTDKHLVDLWRKAVGPQIAAQTHPDTLKRGSLFIRVSAPVWLHQLQFMKEEILGKMNELLVREEVRHLFLTIGELPSSPARTAELTSPDPVLSPLLERDRQMIRDSLATVRDPELREIMERVMTREIGHRRRGEKRKARGK